MNLFKALTKSKDKILSVSLEKTFDLMIKEYGSMLKFKLNSELKTIEFEILLKGEIESLKGIINNYELFTENDKYFIRVKEIKTSREWINIIAEQYIKDKKFEIPKQYAKMLKIII